MTSLALLLSTLLISMSHPSGKNQWPGARQVMQQCSKSNPLTTQEVSVFSEPLSSYFPENCQSYLCRAMYLLKAIEVGKKIYQWRMEEAKNQLELEQLKEEEDSRLERLGHRSIRISRRAAPGAHIGPDDDSKHNILWHKLMEYSHDDINEQKRSDRPRRGFPDQNAGLEALIMKLSKGFSKEKGQQQPPLDVNECQKLKLFARALLVVKRFSSSAAAPSGPYVYSTARQRWEKIRF